MPPKVHKRKSGPRGDRFSRLAGVGISPGVVALYVIVLLGIAAVTYYGTRVPLGTLVEHEAVSQAQYRY